MLSQTAAFAEAERLIAGWLRDPKLRVRTEDRKSGADLVVESRELRFAVEYKGSSDTAIVGGAIAQVRGQAQRLGRGTIPVVAVSHMGDVGRRLCAEAGVSWFDLSGNADIVAPGVVIHVEGKPNRFSKRGRPSTAFAPRSARVTRLLLLDPTRSFRQQELARETGLADGFVSRIVGKLEDDGLVRRDESGAVHVVDPSLLLDSWSAVYDFTKHTIIKGHITARSSDALVKQVAHVLGATNQRFAATGLAAAWRYTGFAGFRIATFFVDKPPNEKLLHQLGFREEPRGANVWLAVPNDEGVFLGSQRKKNVPCVHPVQVYLDLEAHPERAREAAAEIRARLLQWNVR